MSKRICGQFESDFFTLLLSMAPIIFSLAKIKIKNYYIFRCYSKKVSTFANKRYARGIHTTHPAPPLTGKPAVGRKSRSPRDCSGLRKCLASQSVSITSSESNNSVLQSHLSGQGKTVYAVQRKRQREQRATVVRHVPPQPCVD